MDGSQKEPQPEIQSFLPGSKTTAQKLDSNPESMRERLDGVSPSFCLAKWYQVTIHLQNGHTHSCHHPATHRVPVEELAGNPSALHNTHFKKQQRKKMLAGARPAECDYCWKVEDASRNHLSDRALKSSEPWAAPHFEAAQTMPWDANVAPTYLEVSFSNVCNLMCSYCNPRDSSKWAQEVKQYGPYPVASRIDYLKHVKTWDSEPIPENEDNPYVDAFWKWWPEIYPKLKVFRITGGEPLLSKHTTRVLEWLLDHPRPDLELAVNSNLSVPDELYTRFLDLVSKLIEQGCIKNFELYTSADAHGHRADYIRNGLDYDTWIANARRFLEAIPNQQLGIMCAFNALSITSFSRFYADLIELRKSYPGAGSKSRLSIDMPYLRYPYHQSVMVLPEEYGERLDDIIAEIKHNPASNNIELLKLERIRTLMRTPWPEKQLVSARADFYRFFSEHDRRRGTNFLKTFPEMTEFWETCRDLAESSFWHSPVGNRVLKTFVRV